MRDLWKQATRIARRESKVIPIAPRPTLNWFAKQMEIKLRENDHLCGWKDCTIEWLLSRLGEEVAELEDAMGCCSRCGVKRIAFDAQEVIQEAADVANFAMMIADVSRRRE
jgi:NTP pyrophosphatase (non-canonical NTP hydrolase)